MSPKLFKRLRRVRLFAGLSVRELESIATRGTVRKLRRNTVFIERGDISTTLFLILSGKVKVYITDGQKNEQVLAIRSSGEHIGELALLTNAARTASVATLKDCDVLVLSRREFIDFLTECPQIALNLDASLDERALAPEIGEKITAQCRAWFRFRHSGIPMIILIAGCTGTGKSTVAAELALRFDIGRVQSTDILRDIIRLFIPNESAPELHVSTYDAWRMLSIAEKNKHSRAPHLIEGYLAQSNRLTETVDAVIERTVKERASIIIEGIHLHPKFQSQLNQQEAVVIPLLLANPSKQKLKQHFQRRGEVAPSRGATGYLKNFSTIWQIQEYLIGDAQRCGVPTIFNNDLDDTLQKVIGVISERLADHFL